MDIHTFILILILINIYDLTSSGAGSAGTSERSLLCKNKHHYKSKKGFEKKFSITKLLLFV